MPHEAGLSIAKPVPLTIAPMPKQDVYHILAGAVYLERGPFFFFAPPGQRSASRSFIPSVGQYLGPCRRPAHRNKRSPSRGRHSSQRAPLKRNSRREVPSDVTHAPNPRGFSCRPARGHRPGNPLRAFCEQNTWHAAWGASHTCPHVNPSVPNSYNTRHLHSCHPRGRLVSNVERSRAGL